MFSFLSHTSTRSARDITPNLCWCRPSSSIATPRCEMKPRKYADRMGSLPARLMWCCRGRRWSCLRLSASKPVITFPLSNAAWAKTPLGSSLTLWLIEWVSDGRYHLYVCVCVGGGYGGGVTVCVCHCVCVSLCVCMFRGGVTVCAWVGVHVWKACHCVCVYVWLCVWLCVCCCVIFVTVCVCAHQIV